MGTKDFSVVYQPLASEEGLLSPLQKEVETLKEENKRLKEELSKLKK